MQQVSPIYILSYFFANIATSEQKNEVYFGFFTASAGYIRAERKSATSERKISSLLEYFLQRAQAIFARSANQPQASKKTKFTSVFLQRQREISVALLSASLGCARLQKQMNLLCTRLHKPCDDGTFMFPKECGLPPQRLYSRKAQISNKRAKKRIHFLQGRRLYLDYTSTITKLIQQKTIAHRTNSPIFTTKNKKKYKFIGDSK